MCEVAHLASVQLAQPQRYLGSQAAPPCLPLQPALPDMQRVVQITALEAASNSMHTQHSLPGVAKVLMPYV